MPFSHGLVGFNPGVCGGHVIIKGHRIEVSNLVEDLYYHFPTPEKWISAFHAETWLTSVEITAILAYCACKACQIDDLTCCHCTLNPKEGNDPENHPFNGWKLAEETLERLRKQKA